MGGDTASGGSLLHHTLTHLQPPEPDDIMADMSDAELHEIYDFAVQLGKDAGDLLMKFAMARFTGGAVGEQAFEEKDNAVDIVTKVDQGEQAASSWQWTGSSED